MGKKPRSKLKIEKLEIKNRTIDRYVVISIQLNNFFLKAGEKLTNSLSKAAGSTRTYSSTRYVNVSQTSDSRWNRKNNKLT